VLYFQSDLTVAVRLRSIHSFGSVWKIHQYLGIVLFLIGLYFRFRHVTGIFCGAAAKIEKFLLCDHLGRLWFYNRHVVNLNHLCN
jgi:hypothetical protein